MVDVELYSIANCKYCINAKRLLDREGINYTEYRTDLDPTKMKELRDRAPNARTHPQIFVGETHVGGFDDLNALHKAGELEKLLKDSE